MFVCVVCVVCVVVCVVCIVCAVCVVFVRHLGTDYSVLFLLCIFFAVYVRAY